jgi:purine-binding chemotaxis protein CheW
MARKKKANEAQAPEIQAIGLRIGTEEYGLPIAQVQEVINTPRITRVPKAPDYLKGVINLRGNVIPVVDVARRLNIGETTVSDGSRIVAVDVGDEVVALTAEQVSKVTRLPVSAIKPPPPLVSGISAEYISGVARLPDRFLIFLDLERVLAEDDAEPEGRADEHA